MVELDQMKQQLAACEAPLSEVKASLDLESKTKRIEELEMEMEAPGFWDDPDYSNKRMKELKNLKDTVSLIHGLYSQKDDIYTLLEMGYEEEDESLIPEIAEELESFTAKLEEVRISTLLSGEYDRNNAILKLNAGAGGVCCTVCIPAGQSVRALA